MIPLPTGKSSLPDTTNGNAGTEFEYARADHQHAKSNLYASASHNHTIAEVTNLQTTLNNKLEASDISNKVDTAGTGLTKTNSTTLAADIGNSTNTSASKLVACNDSRLSDARTPKTHQHVIGDVTNLQTTLDGKAPLVHQHSINQVTDLQNALDAKSDNDHTHTEFTDSGWTVLSINSNFYNYNENGQTILPLQYRKIGSIVQVIGLVGLNADLAPGQWTIATLPTALRPTKELSFLCELNNNGNLWTCIIKTTGEITFNRLRDISSNVSATITYEDDTTNTVKLATNNGFITGTKWVDTLKLNVMYIAA